MKKKKKQAKKNKSRNVVCLIHHGCAKNLIDSEKILAQLALDNFIISHDPENTDAIIINTCGFIKSARDEVYKSIEDSISIKNKGLTEKVILVGCFVELYKERLAEEIPELDGLIGFSEYKNIGKKISAILKNQKTQHYDSLKFIPDDKLRLRITERNFAYLRIAEGCSNCCSYCNIPKIRGALRSKPVEDIIEEANLLVQDGASELIIIGQDTASYGKEFSDEVRLESLILKLSEIEDLKWIRLMYLHPLHITKEIINLFKIPKVVKYIETPIQHVNKRVLDDMGRGYDSVYLKNLISLLRENIPDIVIRTTLMVGFPGESEEEFQEMVNFVEDIKFERLGAFTYSDEEGTPAYKLKNKIPQKLKDERYHLLMEKQQKISEKFNRKLKGKIVDAIVEYKLDESAWQARSYMEAPEIDPIIIVNSEKELIPGKFYKIKITDVYDYDLIGVIYSPRKNKGKRKK